jgi:hypothetical protein
MTPRTLALRQIALFPIGLVLSIPLAWLALQIGAAMTNWLPNFAKFMDWLNR